MRIGIIAEDSTDFETIRVIISKIIDTSSIGFKLKVGSGSAKIKSRCTAWATDLNNRNCSVLVLVTDLDSQDYNTLRKDLDAKLAISPMTNYIVSIPIEELEAWLISDPQGIMKSLRLKRLPKFLGLPETVTSPKEKLRDQIYACSGKELEYQTKLNYRIAESINLDIVYSRCPSFREFFDFIKLLA